MKHEGYYIVYLVEILSMVKVAFGIAMYLVLYQQMDELDSKECAALVMAHEDDELVVVQEKISVQLSWMWMVVCDQGEHKVKLP